METIEVTHKGVTVKIKRKTTRKRDANYVEYQIADYTSNKLVRHSRANLSEAKAKAKEICEAMAGRKTESLQFKDRCWDDIRCAADVLTPYGLSLPNAAHLLASALSTGVRTNELLVACQHWLATRPDKPFAPKLASEAATAFLATQRRVSDRRRRTLKWYVDLFSDHFGDRMLHTIADTEVRDFVDHRKWGAKTSNEWLNGISLLFKEAKFRGWVPSSCNPCASIKRQRLNIANIGIYEPAVVKVILSRVREELVPFTSIWFFMGARKEEICRLRWSQIRSALRTGYLHIEPEQGRKTGTRSPKLLPNLRAWLEWYLVRHPEADGYVVPTNYTEGRKLDDLTKKIARDTQVPWVANAPRHAFCTYHLSKFKDAPDLIKSVGNSFRQLERHYWNKSHSITPEMAEEYFGIVPDRPTNVVAFPNASEAVGTTESAANDSR